MRKVDVLKTARKPEGAEAKGEHLKEFEVTA
jgi:hypothetical protein